MIWNKHPLSQEQKRQIEATLNEMGPRKVTAIHSCGTVLTLPLLAAFCVALSMPFFVPDKTIFAAWDGVVVTLPNWVWLLALLPIFLLSGISANIMAVALVRIFHKIRWPGQSSLYLNYLGEATSVGEDGYKVRMDYDLLSRGLFAGALASYAATLVIFYLGCEVVTKTHFHKRSILPFLNQTIDHDDLIYVYNMNEKSGGDLQLLNATDGALFLERYLRAGNESTAKRIVEAISGIPNVTLKLINENR